jgi:hypothetical protein
VHAVVPHMCPAVLLEQQCHAGSDSKLISSFVLTDLFIPPLGLAGILTLTHMHKVLEHSVVLAHLKRS